MSVIFRIQGGDDFVNRLNSFPEKFQQALIKKMEVAADDVSNYIKDDLLSGTVLNAVTGKLRASIYARVYPSQTKVTMSVGSRGDVPYAAIFEFGGSTGPHDIYPSRAAVLSFVQGGKRRFANYVHHPGSKFSEHSYLRRGLRDKETAIGEAFRAAWGESVAS